VFKIFSAPPETKPDLDDPNWERAVLRDLATTGLKLQQRSHRWGVFFKLFGVVYLLATFALAAVIHYSGPREAEKPHTALVELRGVIAGQAEAGAQNVNDALEKAFKDENSKGVILRINSPGGSPVQSDLINREIGRLKAKYKKPIYAVVEDMCASGGYFVAVAADKIFVNPSSVIGSIGVLMDGFGFTGVMEKLGVERRLLTAGEAKGFLDPYSPQVGVQKEHAQKMLAEIHQQFITAVKNGRGNRLKPAEEIFSGLMWTGDRAIELGLVDEIGSIDSVARDVLKHETIVDYTLKRGFAERLAQRFGSSLGQTITSWLNDVTLR
jgi:protease-4